MENGTQLNEIEVKGGEVFAVQATWLKEQEQVNFHYL